MTPAELKTAADQIAFARSYTLGFLEDLGPDEWFRFPPGGVTHIAWQVGHLTMAEYRLALERIRGRLPTDDALISEDFLRAFGRDSAPAPDPSKYPPVAEIRAVFDGVHAQTLREVSALDPASLSEPPLKPHGVAPTKTPTLTKMRCLLWCGQHEMVHAGQIALIRRLLGRAPIW